MMKRWITKIIVTILKWFGTQHALFSVQSRKFKPGHILIYIPPDIENNRLTHILKMLKETIPDGRFEFLTGEGCPEQNIRRIMEFRDTAPSLRSIVKKDIRWYQLLKPELIEELQSRNYDLAIDFDIQFNLTMAHTLGQSGAAVTIGYYQPAYEDVFHNVLLKSKHPSNYDRLVFTFLGFLLEQSGKNFQP